MTASPRPPDDRPLSPAEAQGFSAGERRAAGGYYRPY